MKGVLLFLFCIASIIALGQPGDPGGGGNPTPITGIEFLLGGGAILGIRKLLRQYNSSKKQ